MSYLKDREIWLSSVPTGNPPAGYVWVFIQNGVFVVRDSNGVDKIMATTTGTVTNATSASYVEYSNVANKPALISGSSQVSFNGITDKPALVSSSAQIGGYGVFATTGSNTFQANQTITGSLFITQNLVVAGSSSIQYISSSVLDIADNIITVNAFNPAIRFGGLAVIDSGSSPQVSGSLLFDSIKDQWIFVHQNQAVVTSSVVLMGPETYNDLGNESYISANRLPKGSGVEHLRDSNITDTGTVVSVNSNTQVTGSFTVVSGSAVELQVTNTGVRLGSALTDAHIVTGSLGVTGSLAIAGAGTNSGIRVGSTDGGRAFIRQSVGGDAEIGAITNGGLFLYANNTLGLSFTGAAATFASTVTALGGYLYGQTVNSFVRLDNSIGSQIGYLNYADVTFDSDGLRFFTGTGTSGSRTQKLLLAANGAATFSGSIGVGGGTPSIFTSYSVASFGSLSTTNNGITIASTTAGSGLIEFADGVTGNQNYRGYIQYSHLLDTMYLATSGTIALTIASTGAATFSSTVTLTTSSQPIINLNTTSANQASAIVTTESGTPRWAFGTNLGAGDNSFNIYNYAAAARYLTIASTGAATFASSVSANGVMSLGNDAVYGSTYKTLGLTGNTNGTHRIFAGTADNLYIAAATARGISFWVNGTSDIGTITSDGYVRLTSASGGIQFNGDTAAANALDDYEEGTWTPTSVAGGLSFNIQGANYTKVGRLVTLQAYITMATGGTADNIVIGGVPFTNISTGGWSTGAADLSRCSKIGAVIRVLSGGTTLQLLVSSGSTSGDRVDLKGNDFGTDSYMIFTVTYQTT
jgi:hypothetical protein